MDEFFMLPVTYKGEELEFEAKLLLQGYIHRFEVIVNDIPVQFEPDEEGSYRALLNAQQMEDHNKKLSHELLQSVAQRLEALHHQ